MSPIQDDQGTFENHPGGFSEFEDHQFDPDIDIAAQLKHRKGCTCKKSGCVKGYCECFSFGVPCSHACKCKGCKNCDTSAKKESPQRHSQRSNQSPFVYDAKHSPFQRVSPYSNRMSMTPGQRFHDEDHLSAKQAEVHMQYLRSPNVTMRSPFVPMSTRNGTTHQYSNTSQRKQFQETLPPTAEDEQEMMRYNLENVSNILTPIKPLQTLRPEMLHDHGDPESKITNHT